MTLETQIRNLFEGKQKSSISFALTADQDFGNGLERTVQITLENEHGKAVRDMQFARMTEPGWLKMVIGEMLLTMTFQGRRVE